MSDFNIGDKVMFKSSRGKTIQGLIARFTTKTSRKRQRLARQLGINDSGTTEMAEIAMEDEVGYWKVPLHMLTLVKKASKKDVNKAIEKISDAKHKIAESKHKRALQNQEKIENRGLEDLKPGDEIEVKFKGGYWLKRKFRKISASGKIGFVGQYGKNRWAHPETVRIPEKVS